MSTNVVERITANTMPVTETSCLIWLRALDKDNYGLITIENKSRRLHRVVWEIFYGKIPEGMVIDHKCYVPTCCNPQHLRLATISQNSRNRSGAQKDNTSGHRNIYWHKGDRSWRVKIAGKNVGQSVNIDKAIAIRDKKRLEMFGEFAGRG